MGHVFYVEAGMIFKSIIEIQRPRSIIESGLGRESAEKRNCESVRFSVPSAIRRKQHKKHGVRSPMGLAVATIVDAGVKDVGRIRLCG